MTIHRLNQRQNETSSATGPASPERHSPAQSSQAHFSGLDRPRRTVPDAAVRPVQHGPLPEVGGPDMSKKLQRELLRHIAGPLDARDALSLAVASKSMRDATGLMAVAKAVSASPDPAAAVRRGLEKVATIPDAHAQDRRKILQSVAGRIGQSGARSVELVHTFLRTIAPLSALERADALASLNASLPRTPEYGQAVAVALVDHAMALERISALPDDERGLALAAHAKRVSSMPHAAACLGLLDDIVQKLGQLPGTHRIEALTAAVAALVALSAEGTQPRGHQLIALSQAIPADKLGQLPLQLLPWIGFASEPSEACDRIWNHAIRLAGAPAPQREQTVALLAEKIPSLTPAIRHAAFDRTLALLMALPPQQARAEALEQLAKAVEFLPEPFKSSSEEGPGRADALRRILDSCVDMDHEGRTPVLTASAAAMKHVTHHRQEMFDRTLAALRSLPRSWQQKLGLNALVDAAKSHANDRLHNFSAILGSLDGLNENDHLNFVVSTARALGDISDPGSLPLLILEQVTSLVEQMDETTAVPMRQRVLKAVFERTRWSTMSSEDLASNADAALSALSALSSLSQWPKHILSDLAVDAALHLPILQMEPEVRTAVFMKLLELAESAPNDSLLGLLARRMHEANDPVLWQRGFGPLLRLIDQQGFEPLDALKHLARRLPALPETELRAAWGQVRAVANRPLCDPVFSIDLDRVIAGLTEAVPRLSPQMQSEAVEWVQQSIPRLFNVKDGVGSRSRTLAKLAWMIPDLPQELREGVFERVLSRVGQVLEADRRAEYVLDDSDSDSEREMHPDRRTADLLATLARAAGALPGLAPRAAISQILSSLQDIADPPSRAEALTSLAREALPAALERPVTLRMRTSEPLKRHVSRELLLQDFAAQTEQLPPQIRVPTLQQMLQESRAPASKRPSSSDDKSAKLPVLLEGLLQKATRELDASADGGHESHRAGAAVAPSLRTSRLSSSTDAIDVATTT